MSLRLKFLLTLLVFAGVIAAVTVVWNLKIAMDNIDSDQIRHMTVSMNELEASIEYLLRKDDFPRLKEKIYGVLSDENVRNVVLMDSTGKVISASKNIFVGKHINDVLPVISEHSQKIFNEITAMVKSNRVGSIFLSQDGQNVSAIYPVLFPSPGISIIKGEVGTIFVQYDLSHRKSDALNRVLIQTAGFSIFAVVSSLLVALSFHFLFGKRMTRLMAVVQAFSVDKVYVESNIKGTDEVGRLAAQFDLMAKAIERDITKAQEQRDEILRLNTDLVRADGVKDEFIEDMNHELRTPLTSIIGYMEVLIGEDDSGVEPEFASSLKTVQRNALRLQLLIENLMHASGAKIDDTQLVVSTRDVGYLLGEVVTSLQLNADHAGVEVTLRLDSPASDLLIDGDVNQLEQVFVNLVHNAIKYTPREGKVTIVARRAHTDGDYVEVTVTDTGIGISREDFPRVFERFFRASTATEASIPGFGLGLSLAHSIVDAHHGTITFDSSVGKGTVFTVRLPVKFIPTGPPNETT